MTVHYLEEGTPEAEGTKQALAALQAMADKTSNAADFKHRAVGCQLINDVGQPILFAANRYFTYVDPVTTKQTTDCVHAEFQAKAMAGAMKVLDHVKGGGAAVTLFPCEDCMNQLLALKVSKIVAPRPKDEDAEWYPGDYLSKLDQLPVELVLV